MDTSKQLGECLATELRALKDLEEALAAEHTALVDNDLERLESATQSKRVAVEAQQQIQQRRMKLVEKAGMPADVKLSELVRWLSREQADIDSSAAAETGEKLISVATRCNELNRNNGGLILRQQDRTRQTLEVLRGVEGNPHLYSLNGDVANAVDSRSLGKA